MLCGITSFALCTPRAQAATLTVTNLNDSPTVNGCTPAGSGDGCTLREAITEANSDKATDTIVFANGLAGGTLTLNQVLPDLSTNLNISNPAAQTITLARSTADGTAEFRILRVNNGTSAGPTVNLSGLTVTNGYVGYDSGFLGGGILNNAGTLALTNCTVSGNASAESGGGIDTEGGTLTLLNCTVVNNGSGVGGAGIGGGGVSNFDGAVTLINTTLSGNFGVHGGGLYSTDAATLINCTIVGNTGDIAGGGLGLWGTNTVSNCTITGNINGSNNGGGIDLGAGSTTFSNNIIVGNTNSDVDLYPNVTHRHISKGYNLVGTSGTNALTFFNQTSDKVNVTSAQLNLGPLQNNGGPTQTRALLAGSLAIDAGNPSTAGLLETDQRGEGYARVANGRVDIGAYEVQAANRTTLRGRVYNAVARSGLGDLKVKAVRTSDNLSTTVTSDSDGNYTLTLEPGTYTLSSYRLESPSTFPIIATFANPVTVASTPLSNYNFRSVGIGGRVINPSNVGIQGVTINLYSKNDTALKKALRSLQSDAQGFFSFDGIIPGTWNIMPVAPTTYTYTPGSRLIQMQNQPLFTAFTASTLR